MAITMTNQEIYTKGGRVTVKLPASVRTKHQTKTLKKRIHLDGHDGTITAEIRHDDSCGNGHNSFSITGEFSTGGEQLIAGCIHDEISEHFPELRPYLKWHLCSTDGPLHYIANTTYHARTVSHDGKAVGDPVAWEKDIFFDGWPIPWRRNAGKRTLAFAEWVSHQGRETLEIEPIQHVNKSGDDYNFGPHYTLKGWSDVEWHQCPFETETEAYDFIAAFQLSKLVIKERPSEYAEEVTPNLEAARSCAIWPDATLEQLQDVDALVERLPALMVEFKTAVESLGFTY